jgi:hypothetical protein
LFSPVGVVPQEDAEAVQRQKETKAAENAVKLTVYQQDEGEETVVVATATSATFNPVDEAAVAEPVVRETKKAEPAAPSGDVSDVIKKWSKKG